MIVWLSYEFQPRIHATDGFIFRADPVTDERIRGAYKGVGFYKRKCANGQCAKQLNPDPLEPAGEHLRDHFGVGKQRKQRGTDQALPDAISRPANVTPIAQ